ncbi:hypothetical protein X801_07236, partial [Opisthorchis viverrini]
MAAGCYATPQFQFPGTSGAGPQQFFIASQTPGTGGQTFLQWSAAPGAQATPAAQLLAAQQQQQPSVQQAAFQVAQQHQQLLFSSQHPLGLQATNPAYAQHIYLAQAPTGVSASAGASYQLLPVGCPTTNFAAAAVAAQLQRTQPTLQLQAAQQQQSLQPQFQQQQLQPHHLQQAHQTHTYIQQQHQPAAMMTAEVAGQANVVSATGAAAPQFITLAPGAPLKVMAVGPNGQLIQTTGLPQFMPAAPVGMTIGQQAAMQQSQPTAIAVAAAAAAAAQRRVATPQQQSQQQVQQANGRAISTAPTAAFFSGTAVSSATIPLVQTAAGGEDLVSNPANGNPLGDENQSCLTTTYTPDLDIKMFFVDPF